MLSWEAWLQDAARAEDCKLSSHAMRALLHLRSARGRAAAQQKVGPVPAWKKEAYADCSFCMILPCMRCSTSIRTSHRPSTWLAGCLDSFRFLADMQQTASSNDAHGRHELPVQDPFYDVAQPNIHVKDEAKQDLACIVPTPLVYRDGVHLFSPRAQHHAVLADEGCSSTSSGKCLYV